MVYGDRLESGWAANTRPVGSNPTPSAIFFEIPIDRPFWSAIIPSMNDINSVRNNMAITFMNNALLGGIVLPVENAFSMADQFIKRAKTPVDESQKIPGVTTAAEIQIMALIAGNRPIEAIKLYRACTGSTLKDSKDVIDRLRGL